MQKMLVQLLAFIVFYFFFGIAIYYGLFVLLENAEIQLTEAEAGAIDLTVNLLVIGLSITATYILARTKLLPFHKQTLVPADPNAATFGDRVMAVILDNLMIWLILILLARLIEFAGLTQMKYSVVFLFVLWILYEPVMVSRFKGTLGHKFKGLVVEGLNGDSLGFWQALVRYFLKVFFGIFSLITLAGHTRQSVHDQLTKSKVIVKDL